jgi:hypothetical protein
VNVRAISRAVAAVHCIARVTTAIGSATALIPRARSVSHPTRSTTNRAQSVAFPPDRIFGRASLLRHDVESITEYQTSTSAA